jgi:membrane dipeptidase
MKKFCDSHIDLLTAIPQQNKREKYIKKIKKYGGDYISLAVFTTENKYSLANIEKFQKEVNYYNHKYDLHLLLSIEDFGAFDVDDVKKLKKLNVFSSTLTWNNENQYAGGAMTQKGLTKLGKAAIAEFEREKVLIDCAHLSQKSFFDVANLSCQPIYNSHANIYSLFAHKRNLFDEQLSLIKDTNGFLGLSFYQKFISTNKISAFDIAKQFSYLFEKYGSKNWGIGSDFWGFDKYFSPFNLREYNDFDNLTNELTKIGFSKNDINSIFYKNFLDFIARTKCKDTPITYNEKLDNKM